MRPFQLIALGKISQLEREFKHVMANRWCWFNKFSPGMVSNFGDKLKAAVIEAATLACNSHPEVGKAEFAVLCMKFGNNKLITRAVHYMEKKISKMLDFDQKKSVFIEQQSIFSEIVMHMRKESDMVRGVKLAKLIKVID